MMCQSNRTDLKESALVWYRYGSDENKQFFGHGISAYNSTHSLTTITFDSVELSDAGFTNVWSSRQAMVYMQI